MSDLDKPLQWIFHGNIVIPTGNPLTASPVDGNDDEDPHVQWLGPGLKLCRKHLLMVDYNGVIVRLAHESSVLDLSALMSRPQYVPLSDHEFLCPGWIDLHIHAPQYAYSGTATDRPLMGPEGWLETYTFPAERSLGTNLPLAKQVYESVVETTLQAGTTTAVYFATLHLSPCKVLVDMAMRFGQRALVGKVCMDRNSPDDYCQTWQENVDETRALIEYIHEKAGQRNNASKSVLPLVLPIVTPRFIPTCTPQLMQALGDLAATYSCHIQSHISESVDEVRFSRHLDSHTDCNDGIGRTDAEIFDSHQLLTDQCIMAHGVYLSDNDLDLLKFRGAAVAHCPLSNFYFAGSSLPCRRLLERGNKVGLGTDVAGGYSPSMANACRMAVIASRSLEHQIDSDNVNKNETTAVLDYRHAFYLATLGGAEALGLQHKIGTFAAGMEFDALILSAAVKSPLQTFDTDKVEDVFQKLCTLGDDRNIKQVFVQGKAVMKEGMRP